MTPQQFIAKWTRAHLTERAACQEHFLDFCELLGQEKPAEADPEGAWYTFERGVRKADGGNGWADVWRRDCFGWEYKGKHKDLAAAYQQLLRYREDLHNPPLLVVCDPDRFEGASSFTRLAKHLCAGDGDEAEWGSGGDRSAREKEAEENGRPIVTRVSWTGRLAHVDDFGILELAQA